ncbi:hypothetical protein Tco_1488774, partial [Tanacetum coccineum]
MTGDRSQLTNFVNKFLGTIKFRNNLVAKILGYGDYQIGNVTILRGICNVSPNGVFGNEVYGGDSEGFGVNPSSDEFRLCNSDEWRFINGGGPLEIRGYGDGDMVVQHELKG